jgi:hypothetical protein
MGNSPVYKSLPSNVKDIVDETINNISINTKNTCEVNSSNYQTLNLSDITATDCIVNISDINQTMKSYINANCFQSNDFKDLLNSEIQNEIPKLISLGTIDGLSEQDQANNITNLKNIVSNSTTINDVSTCMVNSLNSQAINLGGFNVTCPKTIVTTTDILGNTKTVTTPGTLNISNIDQYITSDILSNCLQQNGKLNNALSKFASPDTTRSTSGTSSTGSSAMNTDKIIVNTLMSILLFVAFVVMIVMIVMIAKKSFTKGKITTLVLSLIVLIISIIIVSLVNTNVIIVK